MDQYGTVRVVATIVSPNRPEPLRQTVTTFRRAGSIRSAHPILSSHYSNESGIAAACSPKHRF
jgi:hypothetical protein